MQRIDRRLNGHVDADAGEIGIDVDALGSRHRLQAVQLSSNGVANTGAPRAPVKPAGTAHALFLLCAMPRRNRSVRAEQLTCCHRSAIN